MKDSHEQSGAIHLERVPCPRCGCVEGTVVAKGRDYLHSHVAGTFTATSCKKCGLWFLNPQPTTKDIAKLYPSDYAPHSEPRGALQGEREPQSSTLRDGVKEWARTAYFLYLHRHMGYPLPDTMSIGLGVRCLASVLLPFAKHFATFRLIPHYVADGRLLEIGCGNGDFLHDLRKKGWKRERGIELSPSAAELARKRGFEVDCGSVESVLWEYPDGHFDVIVTGMVLEHLASPFEVVGAVAQKLKPGGEFLFSTVVRDSLDARLYGGYWRGFEFPRHLIYFRRRDLYAMLRDQFSHIECVHQNTPIDIVWAASWRGKPVDRIVAAVARSFMGSAIGLLLTALGLTSRVSFRCRKKSSYAG